MNFYRKNQRSWLYGAGITALVLFLLIFILPGRIILPNTLHLGPVNLRFYGLFLALAVAAGYGLGLRRLPQYGLPREKIDNLLLVMLVGGLIGARLYHVLSEWSYYSANPQFIPAVWYGGLSIFGAMLGGVLALWLYARYTKAFSVVTILDWIVPSVALGQAIGRIGNLFNYEAYGYPTDLPWKMFIPPQFRLAPYELSSYFHPLFLYEGLGSLLIAWGLLNFDEQARPGQLFALWLFLYNGMRFFLEILRIDSVLIGGVKFNLLFSLVLAVIGLSLFVKLQRNDLKTPRAG